MVDIQITYQCNNNCLSCIIPEKVYCCEEVNKEKIRGLLKEKNYSVITIGGGEPSIDPEFFDLVNFASENNPDAEIKILSNGRFFFYEESVKKLLEIIKNMNNIFSVNISLYGTEKVHENITRSKNSFEQTFKGVKNLIDAGIRLNLRIVVIKQNYKNLTGLAELIVEELDSIDRIIFISARYKGKAEDNIEKVGISYDESVKHVQKAVDILQEDFDGSIRLYHFPICVLNPSYRDFAEGLTKESGGVTFLDSCFKCNYKSDCSGIWRSYLDKFGVKEFRPLDT